MDCLLLHLFDLIGFYLAPLFVTHFCHLFVVPGLRVVWLEVSSIGACRPLRGAGFWYWDEDHRQSSHWLIFLGALSSLVVLDLALPPQAQASPLVWGLRPCKLPGVAKTKVSSVQFSYSVMSISLWPHGLQHTRPPCPSLTPEAWSNSCPLSWWCH